MPTQRRGGSNNARGSDLITGMTIDELQQLINTSVVKSFNECCDEKLKPIKVQLNQVESKLDKKLESLSSFKEDIEKSLEFAHGRIADVYDQTIPMINTHMCNIATALSKRMLS